MTLKSKLVQYTTHAGQPVENGDVVVTPICRALVVNLPFYKWVWNRPVAILVEQGESRKRLPIVDVTQLAQIALLAIGLAATLVTLLVGRANKTNVND